MIEKYSKKLDYTYALGMSLVIDALLYIPKFVREVYISSDSNINERYAMLLSLCKQNNIKYSIDDKIINKLSTKENCYSIAIIDKYESKLDNDRHIILKDFNDEGELGTIIRTMASFSFKNLVLINCDIDIYDPMVIRSSMGGYFYVNKVLYNSLDEYYSNNHNDIVSIGLNGKCDITTSNNIGNKALMFNTSNNDLYINHNKDSNLSISSIIGISLDLFKKL